MRSALPLHRPTINAERVTPAATRLQLSVSIGAHPVAMDRVHEVVEVHLLCGAFGRLYYLLHAETPRLRRVVRQIQRARCVQTASGAMLDALGRELAVPRFEERLDVQGQQIVGVAAREEDAAYRRRLTLFRPWFVPTRAHLQRTLDGVRPGGARLFDIVEDDNPLCVALRLVSIAPDVGAARDQRHRYQAWLRDTVLIDPTEAVPAARPMPDARRAAETQMRQRLQGWMLFAGASRAMAPALARALDRARSMSSALGLATQLNVVRAQDVDAGSRWELGLALEIEAPPPQQIADLCQRALTVDLGGIADTATRGLLLRLRERLSAGVAASRQLDAWLGVAGLRTVHPLGGGRMMLSHFSTRGLVISGATDLALAAAADAPLSASLLSENDVQTHAALSFALSGGTAGWGAAGPPWTRVAEGGMDAAIAALAPVPAAMGDALRSIGLPVPTAADIQGFRQSLAQYPRSVFALLSVDAALSAALAAGNVAAWDRLSGLLAQLSRNGAATAALFGGPGAAHTLVVSSIALPLWSTNLAARRSVGFVWRALPIQPIGCTVQGSGTRGLVSASKTGLAAVALMAYARTGATDPFEYRVDARAGVQLNLGEYEFVMNALRRMTPAGVQANTWDLRRHHVTLDPAVGPSPLPVRLNRAFRPYHRPRFAGVDAPSDQ